MILCVITIDVTILDNGFTNIYCDDDLKVHSEQLNNNEYTVFNNGSFYNGLFVLFRNCKLPYLPKKFLEKFVDTIEINISFRGVYSITNEDLRKNRKLKRLFSIYNELTELPVSLFKYTPEIEEIDFSYNRIEKVDPNAFDLGVEHLKKVNLEFNRVKTLDGRLFRNAVLLKRINLKYNRIEYFGIKFVKYNGMQDLNSFKNFSQNCMIIPFKTEKKMSIDLVQLKIRKETSHQLDIVELNCDSERRYFQDFFKRELNIDGNQLSINI